MRGWFQKSSRFIIAGALAAPFAGPQSQALAATQGVYGPTSTAIAKISVIIPAMVSVTNVSDMVLTAGEAGEPIEGSGEICVYSNANALYKVRATSANGGGGFSVSSDGVSLPYEVMWADDNDTQAVLSEGNITDVAFLGSDDVDCSDDVTSRFSVNVASADWQLAPEGVYTDTLTLEISPT